MDWEVSLAADTKQYQQILRLVSAVAIAIVLLLVGLAVLTNLAEDGNGGSMIWFWPAAGIVFFGLALTFRNRLAEWVSPQVFLMASVPVLVLLLSAHVLLPYVQAPLALPEDEAGAESIDLSGDFLETLDGRKVSLSDYTGKVTFINFWATWCGPCRAEMPSMGDLYNELKDEGLGMLAITDEDPETIRLYLQDNPYPFTILLDRKGQLFRRFKIFALPTTLVVNQRAQVVLEHQGGYLWNTRDSFDKFRSLLAE